MSLTSPHRHPTSCLARSKAVLGVTGTSQASASHQPWSKVNRPVRLVPEFIYIMTASSKIISDIRRHFMQTLLGRGEASPTFIVIINSVRCCRSHEPPMDEACPSQPLLPQRLGGLILLPCSSPLVRHSWQAELNAGMFLFRKIKYKILWKLQNTDI